MSRTTLTAPTTATTPTGKQLQQLQPGIVTADEMRQILELDNAVKINEKSKKAWIKQESWRTKGRRRFA